MLVRVSPFLVVAACGACSMEVRVKASELFVMNQSHDGSVDDMTEFSHLHAPALLNNVAARFLRNVVYTRAGEILLAVNPYETPLDEHGVSLYDEVYVHKYHNRCALGGWVGGCVGAWVRAYMCAALLGSSLWLTHFMFRSAPSPGLFLLHAP